jgi:hypothetical protein
MMETSFRTGRSACTFVLLVAMLTLGACATRSTVSASNEIATAQFAIRDARANGAETYSLERLKQAESLLMQAQQTSGAEAERLAEKALVNAQLAAAVAEREGARKQLAASQKMESEAGALRERTTQAVEERLQ